MRPSPQPPTIVVLGVPGTGKTNYAGQVYGRLRQGRGQLLIPSGTDPGDLGPFENILTCLQEGRAAPHTATETYSHLLLPIEDRSGHRSDLRWPDYGGEQLADMLETRVIPTAWSSRLATADGWFLFLRLSKMKVYEDALSRSPEKRAREELRRIPAGWDDNARQVELVQLLVQAAELSTTTRLRRPKLLIALSCWDEIPGTELKTPEQILAERLPLLSSFVEANWHRGALSIWGVASLGRDLRPDSEDEDFQTQGPESFGYVIVPGTAARQADLTLPLAWMLEPP